VVWREPDVFRPVRLLMQAVSALQSFYPEIKSQ
jgi:hypothetical protein